MPHGIFSPGEKLGGRRRDEEALQPSIRGERTGIVGRGERTLGLPPSPPGACHGLLVAVLLEAVTLEVKGWPLSMH